MSLRTKTKIGNGINKVSKNQGQSWKDLLKQLADDLSAGHVDLDNKFKPFPLALEEILFSPSLCNA